MISWLDILIVLPILWAVWKGWQRGFVYEIIMFLSIFAAVYIAIHFSDFTSRFLRDKVEVESQLMPVIAFAITIILVLIGFYFLAKLVSGLANAGAELPNRVGGVFFSVAKTLLMMSLALLFIIGLNTRYHWIPEKQVQGSYLVGPIYNFSLFILPAVEDSDFYHKLEEKNLILTQKKD